jgi:hypothetical protein
MKWFNKKQKIDLNDYIGRTVLIKYWDIASGMAGPFWVGPVESLVLATTADYVCLSIRGERCWKSKYRIKIIAALKEDGN